jgi:hypothetical protein
MICITEAAHAMAATVQWWVDKEKYASFQRMRIINVVKQEV